MKTTHTKKLVRFDTFEPGCNQGMVLTLGRKTVTVTKKRRHITIRNGCISAELILATIETVRLKGRTFLVEACSFDGSPVVKLPSDFKPFKRS